MVMVGNLRPDMGLSKKDQGDFLSVVFKSKSKTLLMKKKTINLRKKWASLVAQKIKNLPVMQESWVQSLGWEDPLEKGMAIHSNILA